MLLDFVDLAPGDWVVQNGANSAVGHFLAFIFYLTIAPSAIFATTFKPLFAGRAGSDSDCQNNGGENCQCCER